MENIVNFHLKINMFPAVKYCCILHGRVCVMPTSFSGVFQYVRDIQRAGARSSSQN